MIPILQTESEVISFLPDVLTCVVTEERNGIYELSLTYPVNSPAYKYFAIDKYIKAKPNDTALNQLFRIYEITKPINGIVTVNAEHISYSLSHYPVTDIDYTGTAAQVMSYILARAESMLETPHGFSVKTTELATIKNVKYSVGTVRSALGGSDGSVLDTFGGEFEFDNKVIALHQNRGKDTGVLISYGKNLTDVKATTSMENSYTHLFPYAMSEDKVVMVSGGTIPVENKSGIAERICVKDFSSFFDQDEEITPEALLTKANTWLENNDINSPTISVSVSFIHLWQSPEYADMKALEKVSLCDTVTVRHTQLGVDIKAKVIKTVYDTISEKYEKIEIGSAKANFVDTLSKFASDLEEKIGPLNEEEIISEITKAYTKAIDEATKAITGATGGYLVLNPSLHPQELLILDEPKIEDATRLWRWNLNGLGYSKNGYDGPYETAITMDGSIVADFITTGTLTANIIRAGVMQSVDGKSFFNLETGLIQTNNARITGGTIKIGTDTYFTQIDSGALGQFAYTGSPIGGLVPTSSGSYLYNECLFFVDNGVAEAVKIAYKTEDTGVFITLADFKKDYTRLYNSESSLVLDDAFFVGDTETYFNLTDDYVRINVDSMRALTVKHSYVALGFADEGYVRLWDDEYHFGSDSAHLFIKEGEKARILVDSVPVANFLPDYSYIKNSNGTLYIGETIEFRLDSGDWLGLYGDYVVHNGYQMVTMGRQVQMGIAASVTTSGTTVYFDTPFDSIPIVNCTPYQRYAGTDHFIMVNITNITTTSFTVKTNDIYGTYGSDVCWTAIGYF